MPTLAQHFPLLTSLDIRLTMDRNVKSEYAGILPVIATLSHLRKLYADLSELWEVGIADICALHNLTQLPELSLLIGACHDTVDADISQLLRRFMQLKKLKININMPRLTPLALRIVGETLPQLRCLELVHNCCLSVSLEAAGKMPLFPSLGYLDLFPDETMAFPGAR
jgi:hypothetical protein